MSDTSGQGIPDPEGPSNMIDTDYEVGQDNISMSVGPFGLDTSTGSFSRRRNIFVLLCLFLIVSPWQGSGSAARMPTPVTIPIPAGSRCCSRPAWASG
jgi:BCCT family betaine/carnitine transporter